MDELQQAEEMMIFENDVRVLMKEGLPQEYAILSASAKLTDKTIFNNTVAKLNRENQIIESQMKKAGFLPANYIIDASTNKTTDDDKIKDC
jgi:hypothetical protein